MPGSGGFWSTGGSSGFPGGGASGGFPGGGASGGRSGSSCGRFSINHAADLIFVVGRNQSMATNFNWVQSAIESVVSTNEAAVDFGYQDFPSRGTCMSPNACCASPMMTNVYPQHLNSRQINEALQCDPGPAANTCVASNDSRPISETLMNTSMLFSDSITIDQYVVLLTDGPPGCPGEPNPCGDAASALSKLNAMFIKTFVVAIGSDAQMDSCLTSLVRQGVAQSLTGASDMKSLVSALNSIVGPAASASCVITLLSPPPDPQVTIIVQGSELKRDSTTDGWAFSPPGTNRIQVYGPSCNKLQNAPRSEIHVTIAGCSP